jgi:hypothetical protein
VRQREIERENSLQERLQKKGHSQIKGMVANNQSSATFVQNLTRMIQKMASTTDQTTSSPEPSMFMTRRMTTTNHSSSFKAVSREHAFKNYVGYSFSSSI